MPTPPVVVPVTPTTKTNVGGASRPFPTTEPVLPVFVPPAKRTPNPMPVVVDDNETLATATSTATAAPDNTAAENAPKKRNRPIRDWPPLGTKLVGEYFGAVYNAEIVVARKKLKSGKQIRLVDGPAQGKRLDSFSKAALVATARQRRTMKLGRKGMSSGWSFWSAMPLPAP